MAGGMGRYLMAWMDGDRSAKDQAMQMMKEAVGMQQTMVGTRQTVQDIRLAEAGEERKRQLFPIEKRQTEATAGITEIERDAAQRVKDQTLEVDEYLRTNYDTTLMQLEGILAAEEAKKGAAIIQAEQREGIPQLTAKAAGQEAQVELQRQEALRIGGAGRVAAAAEIAEAGARIPEAGYAGAIAEERLREGLPSITVRAEKAAGEAARAKAVLDKDMTTAMQGLNYANIAAEAETAIMRLKPDVLWASMQKDLRVAGGKPLSEQMQLLRIALGDDDFMKFIVEKNMRELDTRTAPDIYYRNIQSAIQHIASLKVQMDEGVDPLTAIMARDMTPEQKLEMFGGRRDEELSYDEVFSSLQGYIRVQTRLLWDQWEIPYGTLSKKEYAGVQLTDEHIGMAIDFIEKNRGLPGAIGNLLRQWPAVGFEGVNQATVMSTVSGIINSTDEKGVPTDPMMWPSHLERLKNKILAPGSIWGTEDDYNAAMLILTVLSMQVTTPGTLGANAPVLPAPVRTPAPAPAPAPRTPGGGE